MLVRDRNPPFSQACRVDGTSLRRVLEHQLPTPTASLVLSPCRGLAWALVPTAMYDQARPRSQPSSPHWDHLVWLLPAKGQLGQEEREGG